MAKIVKDEQEIEVKDGDSIIEACEHLWVPFVCKSGICQSCAIEIVEGQDNLSDLTEQEQAQGMSKNKRLACQCRIKQGIVKIKLP